MDFDLSDEQRMLRDNIERLLAERYGFESRRHYLSSVDGWSRTLWRHYAETGLLALPFAPCDGGLGSGAVETLLVMESFGRALVLEPYLATVILAGGLLRAGGSRAQIASLAPRIAAGDLLLAFAQAEAHSRYDLADVATTARRERGGWVLNGSKRHVLHGDCADKLIVAARTSGGQRDPEGITLFIVDCRAQDVRRRGYLAQDRLRAAEIDLIDTRAADDCVIGEPGAALPLMERVVDDAVSAVCAEAVGVMDRAREMALGYLKQRKQFGVSIGSFQALQHRAADMLIHVELARSMALYSVMMADHPDPLERTRAVSAAKAQIGRSGKFVCEQAIQLHGGIGMTDESQIGHYYRRMTMLDLLFGDSNHHLTKLARSGGLTSA